MVKLDVFSDPICPWCYIGKAQLDRALSNVQDHPFTIEWHPFQLNFDMPPFGMDRREYLEHKFGSQENTVKLYAKVQKYAEDINLPLNLAAIKRTPNTMNAHRLIHWAGIEGVQNSIVDALFKAYFVEGLDIGDTDILVNISETAGMNIDVVRRLMSTDAEIQFIKEQDAKAREKGVTSAPTFIVAHQHAVSGAQPSDMWAAVISEVQEKLAY